MLPTVQLIFVLVFCGMRSRAQSNLTLWGSRIPLAIRSPYLNAFLPDSNVPFDASNVDGTVRAPTQWPLSLAVVVSN